MRKLVQDHHFKNRYYWYMSNKPDLSLHIFIFMQRIKRYTSPSVVSSYFKIINHMHETWFSKHTFKRTRWFFRIRKIFDKWSRPTIRELLPQYGRKNLVTTICFQWSIKEKLNTRFDYFFWECCLLYFVESNVFVVLNPYYLQIQELFYIKLHKTLFFPFLLQTYY